MIEINLTDPSKNSYYYPVLCGIVFILVLVELLIVLLKDNDDLNSSMNNTCQSNVSYSMTFIRKKNALKFRYLFAFILTRAAMWSKAPYLYTLYSTVHKFTMSEIGILYLIDAVAAFIFGPITGQFADKYGRRLFCHFYNFSIILNLLLRMAGTRPLAYLSQIVTGIGAGLINTTFEAWVVSEAGKDFGNYIIERDRFLKKLFRTQNILDAVMSIVISGVCAVIYSIFGLYAPLWISIAFSLFGSIAIAALWDENKPMANSKVSAISQFADACQQLKKREVLSVGLIESIVMAVLNIFLFSWTPILKESTPGDINVGFIFTCMVLTMILGTKIYEVVILHMGCDYYGSIAASLLLECSLFMVVYFADSFLTRLLCLSAINGIQGFFNPLNSIIKSKILIEKYRALLMNIFRIPLNLYVIIVLVTLRYMNPFTVALIAGGMAFVSFLIALSLNIWKVGSYAQNTNMKNSLIYTGGDSFSKDAIKIN